MCNFCLLHRQGSSGQSLQVNVFAFTNFEKNRIDYICSKTILPNEEFVVYPEDIIKRRTHLWTEPELIKTYSRDIIELFNMNENEGLETLRSIFNELEERN